MRLLAVLTVLLTLSYGLTQSARFTVRYNFPLTTEPILGQDLFLLPEVRVDTSDEARSYARLQVLSENDFVTLFADGVIGFDGTYCLSVGARFGFDGPGRGATDIEAAYVPACGRFP